MSNIFESLGSGIFNGISNAKDKVGNGLRSIPQFFESNVVKPISNSMGQQVAKFAGIQNANPQRGFFNTLSDIDNKIKFTASNSPGQNNGMISPKGWTPPQGATVSYPQQNYTQPINNQIGQTTPIYNSSQNNQSIPPQKNNLSNFIQSLVNGLKSPGMLDPRSEQGINIAKQVFANSQNTTTNQIPNISPTPTNIGTGTTIAGFLRQPSGSKYYDLIVNSANNKKVNPALIAAGLFQESGIDPNAPDNYNRDENGNIISTDRGLGQINDKAHPEITDAQARDPNFVIPWKAESTAKAMQIFPNDIHRAIVSYNLGTEGAKNSRGPYATGLGKYGQQYINRLAKNLTPEMISQLGLKVSSPKEEALIDNLIRQEQLEKQSKK